MASRPATSKTRQPTEAERDERVSLYEHDADDVLRRLLRTPPAESTDDGDADGDRT